MAGMAYQRAPQSAKERASAPGGRAAKTQKPRKENGGLMDRLHRLPQAAGIAILALLLAVSVPLGNWRALENAAPKDFLRNREVVSILEDRADAAENILSVARRTGLSEADIRAAELAVQALSQAKTVREVSRADQALMQAVSLLTTAQLAGEDARSMLAAADDFAEQGSFLRQQARDYNRQAEKALRLYDGLPAKAMLAEPELYEGV